jgi:hypothetical protein
LVYFRFQLVKFAATSPQDNAEKFPGKKTKLRRRDSAKNVLRKGEK